jgi:hypothetical protein
MLGTLLPIKAVISGHLSDRLVVSILVPLGIVIYLVATWLTSREQMRETLSIFGVTTLSKRI